MSLRRPLVIPEECLLFVPHLVRRVGDRDLADQLPTDFTSVLRERLLVVPGIVVVGDEPAELVARLRRHGVAEAWAGSLAAQGHEAYAVSTVDRGLVFFP